MKKLWFALIVLAAASAVSAQTVTNDTVRSRIKARGADRSIELEYDENGRSSRIRAVAENFPDSQSREAGAKAINFAAGLLYPGNELKGNEPILFTFWILTSGPRFETSHAMTMVAGEKRIEIGDARYAYRARDSVEYLNFNITRDQLRMMFEEKDLSLIVGGKRFTFTKAQTKLLSDLYQATEVP